MDGSQICFEMGESLPDIPEDINEIWTYGSETQTQMEAFSKTVSQTVISSQPNEMYSKVSFCIEKLKKAETYTDSSGGALKRLLLKRNKKTNLETYENMLTLIDDLRISLQMDQVRFLKEISIFDKVKNGLKSCSDALDACINNGENHLELLKKQPTKTDNGFVDLLERRLDNLRLSKVVCTQELAQVEILIQNATAFVRILQDVVFNTIPYYFLFEFQADKYKKSSFPLSDDYL